MKSLIPFVFANPMPGFTGKPSFLFLGPNDEFIEKEKFDNVIGTFHYNYIASLLGIYIAGNQSNGI